MILAARHIATVWGSHTNRRHCSLLGFVTEAKSHLHSDLIVSRTRVRMLWQENAIFTATQTASISIYCTRWVAFLPEFFIASERQFDWLAVNCIICRVNSTRRTRALQQAGVLS